VSSRDPGSPGPFDGAIRREPAAAPPAAGDASPVPPDPPAVDAPAAARLTEGRARGRHRFAYAIVGLLVAASLVCVALIAARSWYSHTYHYWFLLWNLVLAWVPFVFAAIAYVLAARRRAALWVVVVLAALVWLAFFPNAPYILTDFLHLGSMGDIVPGWYDVLMLYWFAWTGLMLGIVSLYLMHEIVTGGLGEIAGWVFVILVAGLGSVGIYLGRFLRWNSWDLVRRPGPLANELLGRVTDPHAQPRILGFTALFALLFLFIYVAVYIFAKFTKPPGEERRA
jgi:uncharacterized membrane protein